MFIPQTGDSNANIHIHTHTYTKWYTLIVCSFLYTNYTSGKLEESCYICLASLCLETRDMAETTSRLENFNLVGNKHVLRFEWLCLPQIYMLKS